MTTPTEPLADFHELVRLYALYNAHARNAPTATLRAEYERKRDATEARLHAATRRLGTQPAGVT